MKISLSFIVTFLLSLPFTLYAQEDSVQVEDEIDAHIHDTMEQFKNRAGLPDDVDYDYESVIYHLYVLDKETHEPIKATVDIKASNKDGTVQKGKGLCTGSGEFILNLSTNTKLTMYITYGDYIPKMHEVDLHNIQQVLDLKEITHTIEMSRLEIGEYISMKNISFEQGKYELLETSFKELNQLVFLLQNNPDMEIEIAGHTDNTGSKQSSQKLSEQRVRSVKQYLVSNGINTKRITEVGYGSDRPLLNNDSEEARTANRRVEFKVTKM